MTDIEGLVEEFVRAAKKHGYLRDIERVAISKQNKALDEVYALQDALLAHDQGGEKLLIALLKHEDPYVALAAAGGVRDFAFDLAVDTYKRVQEQASGRPAIDAAMALDTIRLVEEWNKQKPPSDAADTQDAPSSTLGAIPISLSDLESIALEVGGKPMSRALKHIQWPSVRLLAHARTSFAGGNPCLGGHPDLPAGFSWPRTSEDRPLAFIAQIDLAAIAEFRAITHLPDAGHLLFFYDAERQPWGEGDEPDDGCRVLFVPPGEPLVRLEPPPDLDASLRFRARTVTFAEDVTLPGSDIGPIAEDPSAKPFEMSAEIYEAYDALWEAFQVRRGDERQPFDRMFGFPDELQGSMALAVEHGLGADATDDDRWRLLLQVDSERDDGEDGEGRMFWGSGGRLYFWIKRRDLLAGRFSDVHVALQCT